MKDITHFAKWNYYYKKVWKWVSWWYDKPDSHISDFLKYINAKSNISVLDVWCWFWKNASLFIDKNINYTWIDIWKYPIEEAKKLYKNCEFIYWDIISHRFDWNKYDLIIDAGCIHVNHPNKLEKILDKYYEVGKDNWKVFIRIFKWNTESKPLFFINDFLPVWWYTKESFKSHIDLKKFNIDKIILDRDYYAEDELYYFYLTIKK